jgi:hypothetical protein
VAPEIVMMSRGRRGRCDWRCRGVGGHVGSRAVGLILIGSLSLFFIHITISESHMDLLPLLGRRGALNVI